MKKILFVITKSNWGGAQRYVHDLAVHLPPEEFSVTVAAGGNGALITKLTEKGIPVIAIPHLERDVNIANEFRATLALWHIIQKERPNIIHLNSSKIGGLGALVAYTARLFTKQYRPKIIFTVHGWAFNEDRSKWARYLIRLIQWVTALFCDWMIIISNRDYLQAIHLPLVNRKKFVLIPLGVPLESITFLSKTDARAKLSEELHTKIPARAFVIGTIAELTKNKGLIYFVNAIHSMQTNAAAASSRVIIIGEGEDRKKLQDLVNAYNLQDTITLAGFIKDAAQYIKAFDIFVLPSLKEGLPYTLIETMHTEVPIIATHVGGIPDLIENETNGLIVPSKNAGALTNAIEKLIADKKLRAQFAKESIKKVETKFSFEAMLRHTIALYHQEF